MRHLLFITAVIPSRSIGRLLSLLALFALSACSASECITNAFPAGTRQFSESEQRAIEERAALVADSLRRTDLHYDFRDLIARYPEAERADLQQRMREQGYPLRTNRAFLQGIEDAFTDINAGLYKLRVVESISIIDTPRGGACALAQLRDPILRGVYGIEPDMVSGHVWLDERDADDTEATTYYEFYASKRGYNTMVQLVLGWYFGVDDLAQNALREGIQRMN